MSFNKRRISKEYQVGDKARVSLYVPTILMSIVDMKRGDVKVNTFLTKILLRYFKEDILLELERLHIRKDDIGFDLD